MAEPSRILTRDDWLSTMNKIVPWGTAHADAQSIADHDAALRELVRDFAADQIDAWVLREPCLYQEDRPPDAPEEFYSTCG
jgi:hypothetical protein